MNRSKTKRETSILQTFSICQKVTSKEAAKNNELFLGKQPVTYIRKKYFDAIANH